MATRAPPTAAGRRRSNSKWAALCSREPQSDGVDEAPPPPAGRDALERMHRQGRERLISREHAQLTDVRIERKRCDQPRLNIHRGLDVARLVPGQRNVQVVLD